MGQTSSEMSKALEEAKNKPVVTADTNHQKTAEQQINQLNRHIDRLMARQNRSDQVVNNAGVIEEAVEAVEQEQEQGEKSDEASAEPSGAPETLPDIPNSMPFQFTASVSTISAPPVPTRRSRRPNSSQRSTPIKDTQEIPVNLDGENGETLDEPGIAEKPVYRSSEYLTDNHVANAMTGSVSPSSVGDPQTADHQLSPCRAECRLCHKVKSFCFSYGCLHFLCHHCLNGHITAAIEGDVTAMVCPDVDCNLMPSDTLVEEFVDKSLFDQYLAKKIGWMISTATSSCLICLNSYQLVDYEQLICGHPYCRRCLVTYLVIFSDKADGKIPCPYMGCPLFVPDLLANTLLTFRTKPVAIENYQDKDFVFAKHLEAAMMRCNICLDDNHQEQMTDFGCRHKFCLTCLKGYVISKIELGDIVNMCCPQEHCLANVHDQFIRDHLSADIQQRYDMLLLKKAAEQFQDVLYCPECSSMVECDLVACNGICGQCHFAFCTSCLKEYHGFTDCEIARRHREELDQSMATIRANCKRCPGCGADIEKEAIGCNHMRCSVCDTQFCWTCLQVLTDNKLEFEQHFSRCQLFEHDFVD